MKTTEIILMIILFEFIVGFIFFILILKANKKIKDLECKHKNVFHYIDGEKSEKTCMNCGKRLKDKLKYHDNKCKQTF